MASMNEGSTALTTVSSAGALIVVEANAGRSAVLAYLARLRSEASRRSTSSRLRLAASILAGDDSDPLALPWHALTPAMVGALASALASDHARADGAPYSARSVNATLAAVRGVVRECWRAGLITRDALDRLADVSGERIGASSAGRSLDAGELASLYRAIDSDPLITRSARDAAMLALLYGAGLRAAEASAVEWRDVDAAEQVLTVRRGKGRKSRRVGLASGALDALDAWRSIVDDSDAGGPILRPVDKGGSITGGAWSTRGIGRACDRLALAASVAPFTPHDLRRTYAGDLLDTGADLSHVQAQLGHASPSTTSGYDRRPDRARFAAARRVHVPYIRRAA